MDSNMELKLSDQLEVWHNEHPEEWDQGSYVRRTDNCTTYCIVAKAASLFGVPTMFDDFCGMGAYMNMEYGQKVLNEYAINKGQDVFPFTSLLVINDTSGFEAALDTLRDHGL